MSQEPKCRCQVPVSKQFVSSYFKPSKSDQTQLVPGKITKLLHALNATASVEDNTDCANAELPKVVVIEADAELNAELAKMRVSQALLALTRSFTHLVSFPFVEPTLVASYQQFRDTVLGTFGHCEGIDESLFQNAKKLHLTVSVLTLVSDEHLAQAREILQRECAAIIQSGLDLKNTIEVKGVGIMNQDPTRANVLFAKVEDERLQTIADRVAAQMAASGMTFGDRHTDQSVKLHITMMNTVFARRKAHKRKRKSDKVKPPKYFDCSSILEHFQDHVFACMHLPSVQLNDVHAENELGYYKVIESIELGGPGHEAPAGQSFES